MENAADEAREEQPAIVDGAGVDNPAMNLEGDDDVPDLGLAFRLEFMEPLPIQPIVIQGEEDEEQNEQELEAEDHEGQQQGDEQRDEEEGGPNDQELEAEDHEEQHQGDVQQDEERKEMKKK